MNPDVARAMSQYIQVYPAIAHIVRPLDSTTAVTFMLLGRQRFKDFTQHTKHVNIDPDGLPCRAYHEFSDMIPEEGIPLRIEMVVNFVPGTTNLKIRMTLRNIDRKMTDLLNDNSDVVVQIPLTRLKKEFIPELNKLIDDFDDSMHVQQLPLTKEKVSTIVNTHNRLVYKLGANKMYMSRQLEDLQEPILDSLERSDLSQKLVPLWGRDFLIKIYDLLQNEKIEDIIPESYCQLDDVDRRLYLLLRFLAIHDLHAPRVINLNVVAMHVCPVAHLKYTFLRSIYDSRPANQRKFSFSHSVTYDQVVLSILRPKSIQGQIIVRNYFTLRSKLVRLEKTN